MRVCKACLSTADPDIAQLVERSTVEYAVIEWSLVRFRVSGVFFLRRDCTDHYKSVVSCPLHVNGAIWIKEPLQFRDSIVVSISACHADDPGSIPGRGVFA